MPWYKVVKTIHGRRYLYWQRTYRQSGRVKTENKYIGPFSGILRRARDRLDETGGATFSLVGDVPKKGFVFSPRKDTERVVPEALFSSTHIDAFLDEMYNLLQAGDHYIGLWRYQDAVFMDVVKVSSSEQQAVSEAAAAEQIAIHDLSKAQTKEVSDYVQTSDGSYRYKGQAEGSAQAGGGGAGS